MTTSNYSLPESVTSACDKIAPTWPLDQLIAVNPWWTLRDMSYLDAAARLAWLGDIKCFQSASVYKQLYQEGKFTELDVTEAIKQNNLTTTSDQVIKVLEVKQDVAPRWSNISDLIDQFDAHRHRITWHQEITHQISQFCAAFFQNDHHLSGESIYSEWREVMEHDRGLEILMDQSDLLKEISDLPDTAEELINQAIKELAIDDSALEFYCHSLLLDINGWASWVAYEEWQATLANKIERNMHELLAIRLAWELLLWRHYEAHYDSFNNIKKIFAQQLLNCEQDLRINQHLLEPYLVLQAATELAYQKDLISKISNAEPKQSRSPELQAFFCIDVRSEVMRRALEKQSNQIQTFGFAGFFGLPIQYQPLGARFSRPQLPGLLAPALTVTEHSEKREQLGNRIILKYEKQARFNDWSGGDATAFSMVESLGFFKVFDLLKKSLFGDTFRNPMNKVRKGQQWDINNNGEPIPLAEQVELAHTVLTAMGIKNFAPQVMLVGHGSSSKNNPHACGLDCGACGGQSGTVNVQVLAQLLNNSEIRQQLVERGHQIDSAVNFIPALHDTTTDVIHLLSSTQVSADVTKWLKGARVDCLKERAPLLGLAELDEKKLLQKTAFRGQDWSQVRPEWGLANNASFIIAPRALSKSMDLKGRSFLHDYYWQYDQDFKVLELILTAPMLVTNWINMQYNASVTDNRHYGSGNKVLHNVVGGHIGVFEGNGGDLRIGLSKQSLHDGEKWVHQPLRLSVFVQAPTEAVASIIKNHQVVADLINNQWLYLFSVGDDQSIKQWRAGQWYNVDYINSGSESLKPLVAKPSAAQGVSTT